MFGIPCFPFFVNNSHELRVLMRDNVVYRKHILIKRIDPYGHLLMALLTCNSEHTYPLPAIPTSYFL